MELTFNELKKRDVINIADGRCLGRIKDIRLDFPDGILIGIYVPGRRSHGLFKIFDRSEVYIDESRIIKIGGDVILVDLKCGELCSPSVRKKQINNHPNNDKNRPQKCPPPCPPPCPPKQPPCNNGYNLDGPDFSILSGGNQRIDTEDY